MFVGPLLKWLRLDLFLDVFRYSSSESKYLSPQANWLRSLNFGAAGRGFTVEPRVILDDQINGSSRIVFGKMDALRRKIDRLIGGSAPDSEPKAGFSSPGANIAF